MDSRTVALQAILKACQLHRGLMPHRLEAHATTCATIPPGDYSGLPSVAGVPVIPNDAVEPGVFVAQYESLAGPAI